MPTQEDISRNRPFSIVLGNTTDALPMNGVSEADILYEVLVEHQQRAPLLRGHRREL
jgi:hypothetical protein